MLYKLNADDWKDYKALRLESLTKHAGFFGGFLEKEQQYTDQYWKDFLSESTRAVFGLRIEHELVGITGVGDSYADSTGKTALLFGSYIREEYRGARLSRELYHARIEWAKAQGRYERILVSHREDNEASRRANQAFGFQYIGTVESTFGDGKIAKNLQYELRLQ